ncbi:hypothetical protein VEE60_12020 [Escherichia coli]|nr:hypothetical protein VEE60_12020 [Escherichia coli]
MSTLTKEWLLKTIAELEEERDATPGAVNEDAAMALAAMKLALASLEAEAVGEVVLGEYDDCGCHPDAKVVCIAADGQADWENFKDGTRLYTAPPAPEFYKIGDATMQHIFTPTGITDVSDMQAVFDQIETVLAGMWQPAPVSVPDEWKQWIADAVEYLEGGLEADGELEAEGSIEAKRLLSRRAAMLQGSEPVTTTNKLPEETGSSLQLRNLIRQRHAEWSQVTFGDVGPVGPLKHLSKEAIEAAAEPDDLSEWADMQFLLWDAQRRAGISDGEITAAMEEKLKVNMARQWPEPKDGEPRLHIKAAPQQEVK